MSKKEPEEPLLLLFDGYCLLCSFLVRRILKADKKKRFRFKALGTNRDSNPESVIVQYNNKEYRYFDAVFLIGKKLGGFYQLVFVFYLVPSGWRKSLYVWIARNRYRWFGRWDTCYLPDKAEADRFE